MVNKLSRGLTIWLKEPVFGDIKAYNADLVRWMVNGQKGWTVECGGHRHDKLLIITRGKTLGPLRSKNLNRRNQGIAAEANRRQFGPILLSGLKKNDK